MKCFWNFVIKPDKNHTLKLTSPKDSSPPWTIMRGSSHREQEPESSTESYVLTV